MLSNHQACCKESVISSLINRAMNVVSEENDQQAELQYINNVLIANGYQKDKIEKVKRKISRNPTTTVEETTTEEPKAYIRLPYVPGTSNILRRIFKCHNIKCTFYSKETL